jgi:cytochrome P450
LGLAEKYDHFDQDYLVDPLPLWKRMREEEPVARSEKHGGYYIVSRYDLIKEAAADPKRFSNSQSTGIPPLPIVGLIPIDIDPPAQRQYRRILNPALGVDPVNAKEDDIREIIVGLIEPLEGQQEFDAGELAPKIPPLVTLDYIGFPREEWETVITAVDEITRLRGSDMEEVMKQGGELLGACMRLVEKRKAEPRPGDIMDLLMNGTYHDPESGEDRPLEDQEIVRTLAILLFGAIDTTSLAIAGTIHYLALHPKAQDYLRENGVSKTAVEEMVRYTAPVQGLGRTVMEDTKLDGCPLHKEDKVMLMWASGNRDESAFENPDQMEFERKPNPHLGFGHGPHKCVGLNLGKLMLRITMEEFLARIPQFELADPDGIEWVGGETRGIRRLPIRVRR